MLATIAGLSAYYELSSGWVGLAVPGILWAIGVVALFFCPQVRHDVRVVHMLFHCPAAGILSDISTVPTKPDVVLQWLFIRFRSIAPTS